MFIVNEPRCKFAPLSAKLIVVSLKKCQLIVLRQRCTIDDSQSFVLGLKIKIYSGNILKKSQLYQKNQV